MTLEIVVSDEEAEQIVHVIFKLILNTGSFPILIHQDLTDMI